MKQRNPIVSAILPLIPIVGVLIWWFGWYVSTKNEMNQKYNTGIPTAWVVLIPIIGGLWFSWAYAGAAAKVHGKYSQVMGFLLMLIIAPVMVYLHQAAFNEVGARAPGQALRAA